MFHKHRRWTVVGETSPEELAHKLTEHTWCCCNGFELGGYWFLNDATSADGAQEYAVVKKIGSGGNPCQVESITFGWCRYARALELIKNVLQGKYDDSEWVQPIVVAIDSPQQHGRCSYCA